MLAATAEMTAMLRRFSEQTQLMAQMHAGPDISHRIPEDFPGVYGQLAGGINTVIFEHLDAIRDAIDPRDPARIDGRGQGQPAGDQHADPAAGRGRRRR
ncbi:hypothetical protein G6F61_014666 [Rhizopus arrhizus]|nr:hypothetical protein G6F61_014666 [Rhizopus arrhizus]